MQKRKQPKNQSEVVKGTYSYTFPFKSTEAGWMAGFPIGIDPGPREYRFTVIIACKKQYVLSDMIYLNILILSSPFPLYICRCIIISKINHFSLIFFLKKKEHKDPTVSGAAPHRHLCTGCFKFVTVAIYPFKPAARI